MNKFSASLNTVAFVNWPNGSFDEDHKGDEDHKVDEDHKEDDEDRYKTIGSKITRWGLWWR